MRGSFNDFVACCSDWSAPLEVAARMFGDKYTPDDLRRAERGLKSMRGLKCAEYHKGNNTYKCFPAPTPTIEGGE
jgi:hypothetical protein